MTGEASGAVLDIPQIEKLESALVEHLVEISPEDPRLLLRRLICAAKEIEAAGNIHQRSPERRSLTAGECLHICVQSVE